MRRDERAQDRGQPRECAGQHRPANHPGPRSRSEKRASPCAQPFRLFHSEEVEALASEIAGPGANAGTQELALRVAEAQIDVRRVRYVRHQFLSDTLSKEYYEFHANMRMKVKLLRALLRPNPPDISMETLEFATSTPQGPDKLATILSGEAKKLLAMDRYERRALSRRKFAIRAFDEAHMIVITKYTAINCE